MNLARLECSVLQQRGFNAVFQDIRGTYASGGNFSLFLLDGDDGYATMEWIANQSWHSSGIVTNGMSALGIVQFAVAVRRSPHHAGMWIDWASPSGERSNAQGRSLRAYFCSYLFSFPHAVFSQLSFPQGCFRQHDVTGWLNATARDAPDIMQVSRAASAEAQTRNRKSVRNS